MRAPNAGRSWPRKADEIRAASRLAAEHGRDGEQMTKEWVSLCLSRAIEGLDATVLSELGCPMDPMTLRTAEAGIRSHIRAASAGRFPVRWACSWRGRIG